MKKQIKVPQQLFRAATIEPNSFNPEKKTLRMSISSDTPYLRYDYWNDEEYYEILDHTPEGVDESRLKAGLPILFNHDRSSHLGRAAKYANDGHKISVDVTFSESEFAQEKMRDAMAGVLPDTSVGYQIEDDDGECIGAKDGIPVYKFKWSPYEASLVTVPADISVGVGRQRSKPEGEPKEISIGTKKEFDSILNNENTRTTEKHMSEQANTTAAEPEAKIDVVEVENKATTKERKRVNDINDLTNHFRVKGIAGHKIETGDLAAQFIKEGKSSDEFQKAVMNDSGSFKEPKKIETADDIGMNEKEKKSFSFLRAIYNLGTGRGLQGLEKEASNAHAKIVGVDCGPNSFYVPMDVQRGSAFPRGITQAQRALFSNVYAAAGAFVGTDLMGDSLIELLRNQMLVIQMGARSMSGLSGSNIAIPRQTGGATASWLAEDSTITATNQTVGQLNLTPHKLAAATAFTEQFAMQSSVDAENFVRQDLMAVTALARDLAAIAGTGVSGQPVGILNLGATNLSTPVTLSAAQSMTYANAVAFELNVSLNNANKGKLGYMASPTVKNNAKLIAEISSTNSNPVWKDDRVNGYPALATNQIPTATSVIFGNWDDLILVDFATSNFFVDPYSLSLQGQIRVINRLYCDNGVRHGTSFAVAVG